MKIPVNGEEVELDWRAAALLLAMYWVEDHAILMSEARQISGSYWSAVYRVRLLRSLGLVEEIKPSRNVRIIRITEKGLKAAETIERMAREMGVDVDAYKTYRTEH